MKRFALSILALAVVAVSVFVVLNRPGAEASLRVFITVNSTADTNARNDVLTLREAMMLATGGLSVGDLTQDECGQVSDTSWGAGGCTHDNPPGATSIDGIDFDTDVFPPGTPNTITLGSSLPELSTGRDTVNGSSAGVIVDGGSQTFNCFLISSDDNAITGLEIYNCNVGVLLYAGAEDNTVGGNTAAKRNVISGGNFGVFLADSGTSGNVILGNYIGTNADGDAAVANDTGVRIDSGAQNNTIGGSGPGEGNVISGNDGLGVVISEAGTDGNTVKGNYVGTNADGDAALPNRFAGVRIDEGAGNNTIGGNTEGERNIISGNDYYGVRIEGTESNGTNDNTVKANYIGTDASGTAALPNGTGIVIASGAHGNTVGGTASGEGNLVAFNTSYGVIVNGTFAPSLGNTIRGNSIHSNGEKGIENDYGGNAELEPPTIESAGSVFGTACANCIIDVYSDDEDEGEAYEGSTTADGDGNWSYSGTPEGPNITATATDSAGNTSEFSAPLEPPWPTPTTTPTPTATSSPTPTPSPTASATPGATVMPTPPAGPTRTLHWTPGWHNETWSGSSTPEEAFSCAAGNFAAAYRYVDGGFQRYFPDRLDISNMTDLAQYDTFFILITDDVSCEMPVADPPGTQRTLDWSVGWHNEGWTGADGTDPEDAFACADGSYAAAYRYVDGGLERYFPDRPDISNMGPLDQYDPFLILITSPVSCSMPIAP